VAITTIAVAACIWLLLYNLRKSASAKITSLLVMPLADASAQGDQYFSDGITEELIRTLALAPRLRVPAASSALRLRSLSASEAAKRVGADTVLTGTIERDRGRVRISVELSGGHTWSQVVEEPSADSVVDKIARAVVAELKAGVLRPSTSTSDNLAHDFFLRGRECARKGDPTCAADYFRQALAKDSRYAQAYAELADVTGPTEAKDAALKALGLDESLGRAHIALARALMDNDGDLATAEKELTRAETLTPQEPELYRVEAWRLAYAGNTRAALARIERALDLDPLSPATVNSYARLLIVARDYLSAQQSAGKALTLDPTYAPAHQTLGRAWALAGRTEQAITELASSPAQLAWASAVAGHRDIALRDAGSFTPIDAARIYSALGDRDQAFTALERAKANHDPLLDLIEPEWDKLRDDPRFAALRR
jgi:tetratricopeptide (TPR) repeat protein